MITARKHLKFNAYPSRNCLIRRIINWIYFENIVIQGDHKVKMWYQGERYLSVLGNFLLPVVAHCGPLLLIVAHCCPLFTDGAVLNNCTSWMTEHRHICISVRAWKNKGLLWTRQYNFGFPKNLGFLSSSRQPVLNRFHCLCTAEAVWLVLSKLLGLWAGMCLTIWTGLRYKEM